MNASSHKSETECPVMLFPQCCVTCGLSSVVCFSLGTFKLMS